MSTIWWEEPVAVSADRAWAALRRIDATPALFAPILSGGAVEGGVRTVIFADGPTIRERIVTIDEERKRIVYGVLDGLFEHHSASMQILPVDETRCRFVWISDILPDDRAEAIRPLVARGARAFAVNVAAGIPG
jgi:hypothetical protein